jgi:hypothetical protein
MAEAETPRFVLAEGFRALLTGTRVPEKLFGPRSRDAGNLAGLAVIRNWSEVYPAGMAKETVPWPDRAVRLFHVTMPLLGGEPLKGGGDVFAELPQGENGGRGRGRRRGRGVSKKENTEAQGQEFYWAHGGVGRSSCGILSWSLRL